MEVGKLSNCNNCELLVNKNNLSNNSHAQIEQAKTISLILFSWNTLLNLLPNR